MKYCQPFKMVPQSDAVDYESFLRQRGRCQWDYEDPRRAELVRQRPVHLADFKKWARSCYDQHVHNTSESVKSSTTFASSTTSISAEILANGALALISVDAKLLDNQLAAQARAFKNEGGFTERLYRARMQARKKNTNRT